MKITLNPDGPFMWFLGEPASLIVSLNQQNPGPVKVDFKSLPTRYQYHIITSIQSAQIAADTDINILIEIYKPPESVKPKRNKLDKFKPKKHQEDKLDFLAGQPAKAVVRLIATEKNLYFVKQVYLSEAKNKNRKMVLSACVKRLDKAGVEIADAISHTKPVENPATQPGETMIDSVIESDSEEIVLTQEQIDQMKI